jgi:tryptophanase
MQQLPGQSLVCALYRHAGIRSVEIGTVMFGDPEGGEQRSGGSQMELVRLAIPRRVYTQSHIDYTVEAVIEVYQQRDRLRGLRIADAPATLRHFTAKFEEIV